MDAFKLAANSVAMLYKESVQQSRNSFATGYDQALQDVWEFISSTPDMNLPLNRMEFLSFLQAKHLENGSSDAARQTAEASEPTAAPQQKPQVDSAVALSPPSPKPSTLQELRHENESLASYFTTTAPSIPTFAPSNLPSDLAPLPENLPHVSIDSSKRRWGFSQSSDPTHSRMNLDHATYPEQPLKRTRVRSDRMQEN
ncbi:hypothetical protein HDU91_003630 [Kappamyces sp. JEL0680]|nr:hypothetical protein HDU91_003630 [Kappamyces sp. JEL0680]